MNQVDNIVSKLRTHTGALHLALEQTPLSVALLNEQVTQENYIAYLQKMQGVVSFYEGEVFPILADTLPDLSKRAKLSLIENDLKYLLAYNSGSNTFKNSVIQNQSIAYALGCMYVMEGSSLGGKVILKHVSGILGIVPDQGGSYFAGYGEETGYYWKSFLHILQNYSANHDSDNEIIRGAMDTFTFIKNHFEQ